MTVVELAVYALLLAVAAAAVWRRPLVALYLFVVGLALHNAAMAALYAAGVRGSTLTAITAWKEILLAVALARVIRDAVRERRLPFRPGIVDALALAFAFLACVYALIPQSALGGLADRHAVALGLRHDVLPVGAFFLGRALVVGRDDVRRIAWTLLGTAAFVATLGIVDVYAVPIGWWRTNGVVDYFHKHLGYHYNGTGGLPENFIYNVGGDKPFLRRLVSTFLSPLASGYLMVVALLLAPRRRIAIPLAVVAFAGLLFTFSRSSLVALAGGLVVLGVLRRRTPELAAAVVVIAIAVGWAHVFPKIAPTGRFTKADLTFQHQHAGNSTASFSATSSSEPSLHEHWLALKDGIRTMIHHPQGYGLGNVGQTASRTGTPLKAGESNYTELGVELGVLGALLWAAWGLAVLWGLVRARAATMTAAFAAILALAVQTDVIGDPWVAYVVWGLAGALLLKTRPQERLAGAAAPTVPLS
ncbi:MAG TPA: O-antigen ligase family protein [Gaiellaceae bacterium]|nr:O-antigen ligase family protein [Gaiellaceae bacterium]